MTIMIFLSLTLLLAVYRLTMNERNREPKEEPIGAVMFVLLAGIGLLFMVIDLIDHFIGLFR